MSETVASMVQALREVPLFAGLSPGSLEELAEAAKPFDAPAGHVLTQPGQPGAGLFVIRDGTATAEVSGTPVEMGPGECFGELALLVDEGTRSVRVRAKTDLEGYVLGRDDFTRILEGQPRMAIAMLRVLARRLADRSH